MKVPFLKEDYLNTLKANLPNYINYYNNEPTNSWIYDLFEENPFGESKLIVNDFELITLNSDKPSSHFTSLENIENVKILHENLKQLSNSQATDERLWTGLTHHTFWKFLKDHNPNHNLPEGKILNRYFLKKEHGLKRALFINPISKLWWLGRLIYDENREDPYELLKYFEKEFSQKIIILPSNNLVNNPKIFRALISALMKLDQEGYTHGENYHTIYTTAINYLNILGGTTVLDFLDEREIEERILNHMHNL